MGTRKTTRQTRTKLTASVADLGCVVGLDLNHFNSISLGFVLDEALQLEERPVTNPIIHYFASPLFPDTFKVFHYNLVSIELGNNLLTDVVINPRHITSFSSAELLEKSSTGASAFGLKNRTQVFEPSFGLLDFMGIKEPVVRCDNEVIYSEVETKNTVLRTCASGFDLFGKCEQEETSAFFINPQERFIRIAPCEIFFITIRNTDFELLPGLEQSQNKDIAFEIGTPWEIVANTSSLNNRLSRFSKLFPSLLTLVIEGSNGCFDCTASLPDTTNSQLSRQLESTPDCIINSIMELEVLGDFMFPSIVNAELQGFSICLESSDKWLCGIDFDFSSRTSSHRSRIGEVV